MSWKAPERGWGSLTWRCAAVVLGFAVLGLGIALASAPLPGDPDQTTTLREEPDRRDDLSRIARQAQLEVERGEDAAPSAGTSPTEGAGMETGPGEGDGENGQKDGGADESEGGGETSGGSSDQDAPTTGDGGEDSGGEGG